MTISALRFLFLSCLAVSTFGGYVGDNSYCQSYCYPNSIDAAGGGRSLKNSVSDDFEGYSDCWSSSDGKTFATNIQVKRGQPWPKITEGITTSTKTSGYYQRPVGSYLGHSDRRVEYSGKWQDRSHGPDHKTLSSTGRQNGAYIWLNDPNNFHDHDHKQNPKWPFTVEINGWNRFDRGNCGGRRCNSYRLYPDYYDLQGRY